MKEAGTRALISVVAGVLSDAAGRVLLAQRPEGKHLAGGWEFPGGKLEPGEERLEGLTRELLEEIGVIVQAARPLVRVLHAYTDRDIDLDAWLVTSFSGEPVGREGQVLRWCRSEDLGGVDLLPADLPVIAALRAGPLACHDLDLGKCGTRSLVSRGTQSAK